MRAIGGLGPPTLHKPKDGAPGIAHVLDSASKGVVGEADAPFQAKPGAPPSWRLPLIFNPSLMLPHFIQNGDEISVAPFIAWNIKDFQYIQSLSVRIIEEPKFFY